MGKVCAICRHVQRDAIDSALAAGTPAAELARRHRVSVHSLRRHAENHLLFRSEKHRGDGFFMAGSGTITITAAGKKRRGGGKRRGQEDVDKS